MIKVAVGSDENDEVVVELGLLELNLTVVLFVVDLVDALEELLVVCEKSQEFVVGLVALIRWVRLVPDSFWFY